MCSRKDSPKAGGWGRGCPEVRASEEGLIRVVYSRWGLGKENKAFWAQGPASEWGGGVWNPFGESRGHRALAVES